QDRLHVQPHVAGTVGWQTVQYLPHLFPHTDGVSSLDVDEGARVDNDASIEGAAVSPPRALQDLMGVPKPLLVEQSDKLQIRLRIDPPRPLPRGVPPSYHTALEEQIGGGCAS